MITWKRALAFTSIVGLFLTACTPEDGATGPVGPVGPEGQIGPQGETGKVNLLVSTYMVRAIDWDGAGAATMSAPDITSEVVTDGTVQVFQETSAPSTSSEWTGLPSGNFSFRYKRDSISFLTPGFTGANFLTYYKVVVIPPASLIDGVNHSDYEELKMVYGLED